MARTSIIAREEFCRSATAVEGKTRRASDRGVAKDDIFILSLHVTCLNVPKITIERKIYSIHG